jgi:hypothetical protein
MSERRVFKLANEIVRRNAISMVATAKLGFIVEVKPATRSLDQNARFWALLTDISEQVEWHGQKLKPEDWKHVFSASLKQQRAVPGLDGGFVVLGQSTSKMTVREMSDLMEIASAFGAERGVRFSGSEE